jgi:hypothetical protein
VIPDGRVARTRWSAVSFDATVPTILFTCRAVAVGGSALSSASALVICALVGPSAVRYSLASVAALGGVSSEAATPVVEASSAYARQQPKPNAEFHLDPPRIGYERAPTIQPPEHACALRMQLKPNQMPNHGHVPSNKINIHASVPASGGQITELLLLIDRELIVRAYAASPAPGGGGWDARRERPTLSFDGSLTPLRAWSMWSQMTSPRRGIASNR